jgi:hypothetical protein
MTEAEEATIAAVAEGRPVDLEHVTGVPLDVDQDGYEVTTADGVWIKQYHFPACGSIVAQHAHVWDHTTMIATGAVYLWKDGALDGKHVAPTCLFIKAGVRHTFQTVADDTAILCIHNALHPQVAAVLDEHRVGF